MWAGVQLLLKHSHNRGHQQRIIAFVGSPICSPGADPEKARETMREIGKKLRASHIALDIALYGEIAENQPLVDALYQEACGGDYSLGTMLVVPPGAELSGLVTASPIVLGEAAGIMPGGGAAAAAAGPELGDAEDQMLLIAIQESLREEAERKERERQQAAQATASKPAEAPTASETKAPAAAAAAAAPSASTTEDKEAQDLQRALVMTMLPPAGVAALAAAATATTPTSQKAAEPPAAPGAKKAVSRIQQAQNPPPATPATSTAPSTGTSQSATSSAVNELFADQDFLRQLLEEVNDPASAQFLAGQVSAEANKDKEKEDKKDSKDSK